MSEFVSSKRITDVSGDSLVGKTISRSVIDGYIVFLEFTDGTFLFGESWGHDQNETDFSDAISITDAMTVGLISEEEFAAKKAESDAYDREYEEILRNSPRNRDELRYSEDTIRVMLVR